MTKNPFINAISATFYIVAVSLIMYYGPKIAGEKDTIVVPIAMISLFTLSAAIMGSLFFYQPFQMYFAEEKKNAINLFIKTLVIFSCFTALIFSFLLLKN